MKLIFSPDSCGLFRSTPSFKISTLKWKWLANSSKYQSSTRGYAFCKKCEDLFSKYGEQWELANIPHDYDTAFPPLQVFKVMTSFCEM